MSLHAAEALAGELIAIILGTFGILWAYRQYVPPPDDPEQHDDDE